MRELPGVEHLEDGMRCLCCGEMVSHKRSGVWGGDPHAPGCESERPAPEGYTERKVTCLDPECGAVYRLDWWMGDEEIAAGSCWMCSGDQVAVSELTEEDLEHD